MAEQAEIYSRAPKSRLPVEGNPELINLNCINVGAVCHANQLETIRFAIQEYIVLMNKQHNINIPLPRIYGAVGECQRTENLIALYKRAETESIQVQPSTSKQVIPTEEELQPFSKFSQTSEVVQAKVQYTYPESSDFENHPFISQLDIGIRLKPLLGIGKDLIINSSTKCFSLHDIRSIYKTSQQLPTDLHILLIMLLKKQNKFNQISKRYNLFDVDSL